MNLSFRRFLRALPALLLLAAGTIGSSAQSRRAFVRGTVCEEDSSAVVVQAVVQLLSPKDSASVEAVTTDAEGRFELNAPVGGYILKISQLGFKPYTQDLTLSGPAIDLGMINLSLDAMLLEGAIVSDKADPVKVVGDTVVYNAAALLVEEDATLDELLKKIPGLEVSPDGAVSLNGRPITQLYIGGKRFFGGDIKAALKNLEARMVENVKAYDRDSDFTRITGIDDGEKEPVLDLTVKKHLMGAWQNNVSVAGGTSQRYSLRAASNKIDKKNQTSIILSRNNLVQPAGISSTGQSQIGSAGSGDRTYTEAGVSFSKDLQKGEISGHLQYSGTDRFTDADLYSQVFNASSSTYNHGNSVTDSHRYEAKGDLTFEWKPDKSVTIFLKPTFNYNFTGSSNDYISGSYRFPNDSSVINNVDNTNRTFTDRGEAKLTFQVTKRLAKRGRNFSVKSYTTYNYTGEHNFYRFNTFYHNIKANPDSVLIRKNFLDNAYHTLSSQLQFSWNEPLGKYFHLQFIARAEYRRATSKRDYYDIYKFNPGWSFPHNASFAQTKERLPIGYENMRYELFCSEGVYHQITPAFTASMRYVRKKFNVTAGVNLRPQWTILDYLNEDKKASQSRAFVFNAAPTISLRYNPGSSEHLSLTYSSWPGMPGIYNMLPVTNGNNPLYIHIGNPYLKPPFTHSIKFNYNFSDVKKKESYVLDLGANIVENSISNSTIYDEVSGSRTVTPQNISGNWKLTGSFVCNKTFKGAKFSLTNHLKAEYQHGKAFLYNNKTRQDEINVIGRAMARELFEACYRIKWVEAILSLGGDYTFESSRLRPGMNRQPYAIYGGANLTFTMPWKMRIGAKYTELYQHGYMFDEKGAQNYHLLNASISQTLLKGKGTLRLDAYDILRNQENVVRGYSATSRSVNTYNGVNFYLLLRFTYRFQTGSASSK